jgi:hypothetical protein
MDDIFNNTDRACIYERGIDRDLLPRFTPMLDDTVREENTCVYRNECEIGCRLDVTVHHKTKKSCLCSYEDFKHVSE